MEFGYLLSSALRDIDSLEEYYSKQHISTVRYVTKGLDKNKYGLAIYKFLCGRIHGEEKAHCLNDDEEKFISDELEIIEDADDKSMVQYKLKDADKFAEYELDPHLAEEKTIYLMEQPVILNNSVIIMLLIKYENAISALYEELLRTFPEAYLKDKSITYSELVSLNSDIEDIKAAFIESEIDEFMRKPLKDWYNTFEQKHKIHFKFGDEFEQFKEIYYRRNVVVHNRGKSNSSYINGVAESYKCDVGKRLTPTSSYLKMAFDCTRIIIIETFLGMTKLLHEKTEFAKKLFVIGYDYMLKSKWKVSKYIFNSLALERIDGQSAADIWYSKVNYYVSCKNLDGIDSILSDVEKMDVSLMKPRLALAKPALLDDFSDVSKILEDTINNGMSVKEIKSWPLLLQYRESENYKVFTSTHSEIFEIKTCSAEDVQCISEQNEEPAVP